MITIDPSVIAATQNFASHNAVFFNLNAVLFERRANRLYVVATDGYVLGLWHDEDEGPDESFLIKEPDVKSALRTFGKKTPLLLTGSDDGRKVEISNGLTTISLTLNHERFPDWFRAIPRECNGEVAQFDINLLVGFEKAAKALGRNHFYVHHNGESGALVEICNEPRFVGVIAPKQACLSDPAEWLSKLS